MAVFGDFVSGQVQTEDHASFYVGGGFGGVDVLALLVGSHCPCGESEGLAALVSDRNDQAFREEVASVAAHKAGLLSVLEAALFCPEILGEAPTRGGVPELEAAGGPPADPAGFA